MSVTGTAKLVIDMGNSETRVTTIFGKNSKGKSRERLTVFPNTYSSMEEKNPNKEAKIQSILNMSEYNEENSSVFVRNGITYCNGTMCDIEYRYDQFRPTAQNRKYEQLISKLTVINAFKTGYDAIAEIANCDLDSIDVDWEVTCLLPPADIDSQAKLSEMVKIDSKITDMSEKLTGGKAMANMIRTVKSIDFIMPELKKDINIKTVEIYPEAFCALIAIMFESQSVLRPEYSYLADPEEVVIIFDIGAGTTDIVLVIGGRIQANSRFTINIGGNNIHTLVAENLKELGAEFSDAMVRKACVTGVIRKGEQYLNIKDSINYAKDIVSRQIVNSVQQFFEAKRQNAAEVTRMLTCGGGSEESTIDGVDSTSDYILKCMKNLSPSIGVVKLPKIDGKQMSPRLLNIKGATILAEQQ